MGTGSALKCSKCGRSLAAGARFCDRCGVPVQPGSVDPLSAPPLRVGEVLEGKWKLEGKLGAGGMGAVFLAKDLALDRKVAIKILAAQLCDDQEFVTRFEREARGTAKLEHPNIVPVHAVGRHQGRPFIVMKALEGQTLSKALKGRLADGRRMGRDDVLPLFKQLCDGLGFIHEKGYVHRDVKSGNVFLGSDGHLTVLDFGVLRDATAERITRSGVLVGTPTYASPEQVRGGDVDSRADLYAVGVLLFECIALKPPFVGDPITLMKQHASAEPPDLGPIAPAVPAAVHDVVKKALAKKREDRYQTARELFAALEAAWPESPLARKPAITEAIVETDVTARVPQPLARPQMRDADASAETLPADAVSIADLLARGMSAPPPAVSAPANAIASPLPPASSAAAPDPATEAEWSMKTEPIHSQKTEKTTEHDDLPTMRIRNVKRAQAEAAAAIAATGDEPPPPTVKVQAQNVRTDPMELGAQVETTGELVRRIKPRRWPYAVGALAALAAAAAAWMQWGAK